MMWFYSDKGPKEFFQAVWYIGKWIVLAPLISAALLSVVGYLIAGWEGAINGIYIGLVLGGMAGVITAGSRALARFTE